MSRPLWGWERRWQRKIAPPQALRWFLCGCAAFGPNNVAVRVGRKTAWSFLIYCRDWLAREITLFIRQANGNHMEVPLEIQVYTWASWVDVKKIKTQKTNNGNWIINAQTCAQAHGFEVKYEDNYIGWKKTLMFPSKTLALPKTPRF